MDVRLTFRRRDHDAPPFILHIWRTSGHRRYAWKSYQSEATERRRHGVIEVRRLIADSMRLLINHPSTNSLCGVLECRAMGKSSSIFSAGVRIRTLVRLSLHYLDSLAILCLLHLHTRVVPHLRIELKSNYDSSVNWNLFD